MHAVHLQDIHVPKGPNLFALAVGEIVCCCIALVFFLISWGVGSKAGIDNLGGVYSFVIRLGGIAIGSVFAVLTKPKS